MRGRARSRARGLVPSSLRMGGGATAAAELTLLEALEAAAPGVVMLLDSTQGITLGTGVAAWTCQVSGKVFSQATGSAQPTLEASAALGGAQCLRFTDAAKTCLQCATASALFPTAATIVPVLELISEATYNVYDTSGVVDGWWRFTDGTGVLGVFRAVRLGTYPASGQAYSMPTSGAHLMGVRSSASGYVWTLDGAHAPSQAADYSAGTTHSIGAPSTADVNRPLNARLRVIPGWARHLTDPEMASVRTVLQSACGAP